MHYSYACVAQFIFEELGLRRAYRTPDVEMIPDLSSGLLNRCLSRPTLVTNDRPRAKHHPHGSGVNRSTLPSSASPRRHGAAAASDSASSLDICIASAAAMLA